jgi:serine/threonine protein phosphatase PrpC
VQPRQASKKFDNCVTKFAFATKTGYSPKNPNKVNQDSFLVLPHLGEYRRTHFFAVADGHGVNGKPVSEYVKSVLAKEVEQSIKYTFDQAKINQRVVDSTEVKEQLDKSFHKVTDGLYKSSGINLRFSGSTCVSVLIVGNKVFCANVGDSRATLARRKEIAGPNG